MANNVFWYTRTKWQNGGAQGGTQPVPFPPQIFAVWTGLDGHMEQGILEVAPGVAGQPGDVDWARVIKWADLKDIR